MPTVDHILASAGTPLVVTLGEEMPAGLARATVRNRWAWVKARSAREAIRAGLARARRSCVIVHAGADEGEAVAVVRFFRAPWRSSPVVVIESGETPTLERAVRGAGVACFLTASEAEPELIEDLVRALAPTTESDGGDREPAGGATTRNRRGARSA